MIGHTCLAAVLFGAMTEQAESACEAGMLVPGPDSDGLRFIDGLHSACVRFVKWADVNVDFDNLGEVWAYFLSDEVAAALHASACGRLGKGSTLDAYARALADPSLYEEAMTDIRGDAWRFAGEAREPDRVFSVEGFEGHLALRRDPGTLLWSYVQPPKMDGEFRGGAIMAASDMVVELLNADPPADLDVLAAALNKVMEGY